MKFKKFYLICMFLMMCSGIAAAETYGGFSINKYSDAEKDKFKKIFSFKWGYPNRHFEKLIFSHKDGMKNLNVWYYSFEENEDEPEKTKYEKWEQVYGIREVKADEAVKANISDINDSTPIGITFTTSKGKKMAYYIFNHYGDMQIRNSRGEIMEEYGETDSEDPAEIMAAAPPPAAAKNSNRQKQPATPQKSAGNGIDIHFVAVDKNMSQAPPAGKIEHGKITVGIQAKYDKKYLDGLQTFRLYLINPANGEKKLYGGTQTYRYKIDAIQANAAIPVSLEKPAAPVKMIFLVETTVVKKGKVFKGEKQLPFTLY